MAFIQNNTVSSLHRLIGDLRNAGYSGEIVFSYNGCGDSGDIETPEIETQMQGTLDALGWKMTHAKGGYRYAQKENGESEWINDDTDHDVCILTLINELLPGGWEINEGSSGRVVISIDDDTIKVEHNQNIMSTEYSEEVY